jgi:asparagine synthase (glutamine-hydrolysing)
MCGIIGTIPAVEINLFKFALNRLAHRGPDGVKIWSDSNNVILGHRRLSIIDLSPEANQPMVDSSGRYVISFNGEIYNFLEIKKELEDLGCTFKTLSDTEVILCAYRQWREACLKKFNGMWALAIWDNVHKTLFLSRDRFGEKPLFYSKLPSGTFVFASEMKAIYPFLKKVQPSKRINEHLNFLFDYEHTQECTIDGIKRIPPGHSAIFKNGELFLKRWWNTLDNLETPPKRYEEQVERWREIFLDSVRIRMRSDVPIGTALSGGLDSSSVFSVMENISPKSNESFLGLKNYRNSFCSHFPSSSLDELKWAKSLTDFFGVPIEICEININKKSWSIEEALYQTEDPYITFPLPMLETYRAISKKGIKVTLDGHGADELFIGYGDMPSFFSPKNINLFIELNSIQESTRTGNYLPNTFDMKTFTNKNMVKKFLRLCGKIPKNVIRDLLFKKKFDWNLINYKLSFEDQSHPVYKQFDPFTKHLYEIFHISILPTLLRNYDRYSMASGVEIRMPFLDPRLVCFTFSLPWTSKIGDGFTKRIMRDALKGILPEIIRTRRDKIGWNAPLHEWFQDQLKDKIDNYINNKRIPFIIKKEWKNFLSKDNPKFEDGQKIWTYLLEYFWKDSLLYNQK